MKALPPPRRLGFAAPVVPVASLALVALGLAMAPGNGARAQQPADNASALTVLRSRARTLEQRGRPDLARQDWQEVLGTSPNDAEALAGLVRAARAEGHSAEAAQYLSRLRASHPNDPELTHLDAGNASAQATADLGEANRLAAAGDTHGALVIYRRLFGVTPPPGAPALAYYAAEGATPEGRPEAIAGLRALADRFPNDDRYPVALGQLLLESPRTHAEGRTLLERYSNVPAAVVALHRDQAAGEHASTPPSSARPLALAPPVSARRSLPDAVSGQAVSTPTSALRSSAVSSAAAAHGASAADEQAGFAALNAHHTDEAERIFQGVLAKDPTDPRALAGLGYVRAAAADLKAAIRYFEQAQENGDRSLALTRALVNTQFALSLQGARAAAASGDFATAEFRYREALNERPADPDALEGLGETLARNGHADAAVPIFDRLTRVRPLSPAAWRDLVVTESGTGRPAEALAADAHVPAEVRPPLAQDAIYQQALSEARAATHTETARVEPPLQPPGPVRASAFPAASVPGTPAAASLSSTRPTSASPAPTPTASGAGAAEASTASRPALTASVAAPAYAAPPPSQPAATTPPRMSGTSAPSAPPLPGRGGASEASPATAVQPNPAQVARTGTPSRSRSRHHGSSLPAARPTSVPTPAPVPVAPPPGPPPAVVIATERTTQGEAALQAGENARAADLFQDALAHQPDRSEAWRGLILALHAEGHDPEAAVALATLPRSAELSLAHDATLQQTAGAALLAANRPTEALTSWARAQSVFTTQHLPPPLDLALQLARLLAAQGQDANLYRQLMYLGTRTDLSDSQRRETQMIWTRWAVRRAQTLASSGEPSRAVVILNAAAEAFVGNREVLTAVAEGYAGIGLPREAVALFKVEDPTRETAPVLTGAVRAATSAHDYKTAEAWVRAGRERFPADPTLLTAAAELEQARGHRERATDLSRQARTLATPQNPGEVLTAELREAPGTPGLPSSGRLAALLVPEDAAAATQAQALARPFLPSAPPADNTGPKESAGAPVLVGFEGSTRQ